MDVENTFGKLCLGAVTGGVVIFSGYLIHRFALKTYPKDTPTFTDFEELQRHLTNSPTTSDTVAIKGTVEKLDQNVLWSEKAGAQGAARQVYTIYGPNQSKAKINMNISVPFKLVGINGTSVKVVSVHKAQRLVRIMQKVWEEPQRSKDAPFTCEYVLTYGTQLGAYGRAEMTTNDVTFTPLEVDTTAEELLHHRNVIKLFYELSSIGFLVLGGFVWAVTLVSVSQ